MNTFNTRKNCKNNLLTNSLNAQAFANILNSDFAINGIIFDDGLISVGLFGFHRTLQFNFVFADKYHALRYALLVEIWNLPFLGKNQVHKMMSFDKKAAYFADTF